MNTKALRQKILDLAIHGKLVPQDPNDEPASVLLERIRAEKERLIKEGKIKRPKKSKAACDKPHYPYELPKGWCWCRLENFMNDATDFVASGSFSSLRENVKYYDEPEYAILVRTKDFQNNFTKGLVYTDRHGYEFLANSNLFGGELILPNIGASIGKVFIVPNLGKRMTLAPNSIMVKCFEEMHKKWLQHLFLSPFGQEQLRIISSSTAQGKFNKTDLRSLYIPVPPQKEQLRILNEVESLFHLVEILESSQDNLQDTIKQAKSKILDLAIQGKLVPQDPTDEPATELLKRINPKAEIACDNAQYEKLPNGWTCCSLQELTTKIFAGGDRPSTFSKIKTEICSIPVYSNGIENSGLYGYTDIAQVFEKCLTISARGTIGFTCIRLSPFVPIVRLIVVIPNSCVHLDYLKYCFDKILRMSEGSSIPQLTVPTMKNILLPLPPLNEQYRIVAKIEELFTQLDNITSAL